MIVKIVYHNGIIRIKNIKLFLCLVDIDYNTKIAVKNTRSFFIIDITLFVADIIYTTHIFVLKMNYLIVLFLIKMSG